MTDGFSFGLPDKRYPRYSRWVSSMLRQGATKVRFPDDIFCGI